MYERVSSCKYSFLLGILALLAYTSVLLHFQEAWIIRKDSTDKLLSRMVKTQDIKDVIAVVKVVK